MKTAYDNFHFLFSTYFHKFCNIAYKNILLYIQKQSNFILSFAIKITFQAKCLS